VLPFNVYDFSVIPIETISAVCEDFIRAEDNEAQVQKGAFVFHSTSKAIYRGRPLLNEVLRLPFPLPEVAPGADPQASVDAVAGIFARVARDKQLGGLGHQQLLVETKAEVWPHILAYFDVSNDEKVLIEDTIGVLQASATPSRGSQVKTLAKPSEADRRCYSEALMDSLRRWAGHKKNQLGVRCIVSERAGVAVLTVAKSRTSNAYQETRASADLDDVLQRLRELSPDRYGSLVYLRNLAVFDKDQVHVVKPLVARYWLRSAALNDADAAAEYLLRGNGRRGV
jgi:hypothetical protein